jgi:DNA mismatch repair protein PMS2
MNSTPRFEELQRTTQLHQQPLLQPLPVETSAALELVIAEHLDAFAQNGFKISADLNAPVGQRVKLLSVPFSKSVRFGVDDVNELASMISDRQGGEHDAGDPTSERTSKTYLALKNDAVAGNDTEHSRARIYLRLPKLVAMYASRACRSAIMIGTALKPQEMSRVVEKLENVEQPWNCPHGRPTLRHLVDLAPLREHRKRKMEDMRCT